MLFSRRETLSSPVLPKVGARLSPCPRACARCPPLFPSPGAGTEEENHLGWFYVEDDGNQIKKERHPLLVGHMPVTVAKQQEFKVTGGGWLPGRGAGAALGMAPPGPVCGEVI